MKPKKLIRSGIIPLLKVGEYETITDQAELNNLYALKIQEELAEVQASDHKDLKEFADLYEVVLSFADANGFSFGDVNRTAAQKIQAKGEYSNMALNNLNPENPSNALYFKDDNYPWVGELTVQDILTKHRGGTFMGKGQLYWSDLPKRAREGETCHIQETDIWAIYHKGTWYPVSKKMIDKQW